MTVNKTNKQPAIVTDQEICERNGCSHGCSCLDYEHEKAADSITCEDGKPLVYYFATESETSKESRSLLN